MLISMQHLMYLVLSRQLFQTYNVHANAVVMKMLKFVIQNARKQKSEHKFSKGLDTWYLCWAKILIRHFYYIGFLNCPKKYNISILSYNYCICIRRIYLWLYIRGKVFRKVAASYIKVVWHNLINCLLYIFLS